jgi:hypothetical protein
MMSTIDNPPAKSPPFSKKNGDVGVGVFDDDNDGVGVESDRSPKDHRTCQSCMGAILLSVQIVCTKYRAVKNYGPTVTDSL